MKSYSTICYLLLVTVHFQGLNGGKIPYPEYILRSQGLSGIEPGSDIIEDKPSGVPTGCGGKPVDVYIAIDTSDGVGHGLLEKQTTFTQNLINAFQFRNDVARVGLVSYGSDTRSIIRLGAYKDRQDFSRAALETYAIGGQRNIGAMLNFIRTKGFAPPYSRRSVAHIIIVMMAGKSSDIENDLAEANLLKKAGVYVYGVKITRGVDKYLLTKLSSRPASKFLFEMDGYQIASSLTSLLDIRSCDGVSSPGEPKQFMCRARRYTDVIFAVDHVSLGAKRSKGIFDFIRAVTSRMYTENHLINVGLAKSRNPNFGQFSKNIEQIDKFRYHLNDVIFPGLDDVILRSRRMFFKGKKGSQRVLVLFVDENVDIDKSVLFEARRNKGLKIDTYVIAIGDNMDIPSLKVISSSLDDDHLISVTSSWDLIESQDTILQTLCRGW